MMKLIDLGFDAWFKTHADEMLQAEQGIARVASVDRNSYIIRNELKELSAEIAGKFYFSVESSVELPCVGDWVIVQYHNNGNSAIIHGVLPRKTFLRRKRAGVEVDYQMIVSNINIAFIVQSCHFDFNLPRMNRYLVMAADGQVEPIIILAKTDLISADELQQKIAAIRQVGITTRVIALSNITGFGFDELQQVLMPGRTYCLLGSSGVGKSTLINYLMGREALDTKAVSETGEGTHTTSRRQLIVLDKNIMFIDTPGMRELGLLGTSDGVNNGFEDIIEVSRGCRYSDCSHTHESDCAVLTAITNGELNEERYASYLKLRKESEHYEMSYLDRRKKDKVFGRFLKTAKKNMKK